MRISELINAAEGQAAPLHVCSAHRSILSRMRYSRRFLPLQLHQVLWERLYGNGDVRLYVWDASTRS